MEDTALARSLFDSLCVVLKRRDGNYQEFDHVLRTLNRTEGLEALVPSVFDNADTLALVVARLNLLDPPSASTESVYESLGVAPHPGSPARPFLGEGVEDPEDQGEDVDMEEDEIEDADTNDAEAGTGLATALDSLAMLHDV